MLHKQTTMLRIDAGSSTIGNDIPVCLPLGEEAKFTLQLFKHAMQAAWCAFQVLKKEAKVFSDGLPLELQGARQCLNTVTTHLKFTTSVAMGLLRLVAEQRGPRAAAAVGHLATAGDGDNSAGRAGRDDDVGVNAMAVDTSGSSGTPTAMTVPQQRRALHARIEEILHKSGRPARVFRFKHFTREPWHSLRLLPMHHNTHWTVAELVAWRGGRNVATQAATGSAKKNLPCVFCGSQSLAVGITHSGNTTRACQVCRVPLCKHCDRAWHETTTMLTTKNRDTPVIKAALAKARHKRSRAEDEVEDEVEDGVEDAVEAAARPARRRRRKK